MDDFSSLQRRLPDVWSANHLGSREDHVLVVLPSFSLGETILAHYASRIPALEHRFLLASLMLPRIPSCEMVFLTCATPEPEVLDYYASLWPEEHREDAARRFHVVEVPDRSGRPVAAKLLEHPELTDRLRDFAAGRAALIEPWNVTEAEVKLALTLDMPVNGTAPDLWPLGFKSEGRRIFERAGVPVPCGRENVHDTEEVAAAVAYIRDTHPHAVGVVVKHDNSGAGDGNHVIRLTARDDIRRHLEQIPPWYLKDLTAGGVVEELIAGEGFSSPSVQVDITPYGDVRVLSTHEQVLGGPDGQVYLGCAFPAGEAYAPVLARYGWLVGEQLAPLGVVGRLAVDFVAVLGADGWDVRALEINLRKGGTTHPFTTLRHLVPGRYDEEAGVWRTLDGGTRCYRSTDNMLDPTWVGLPPQTAIDAVARAGLHFDRRTGTGVVLHMLNCLAVDGRLGLTAIGAGRDQADELFDAAWLAISRSAAAS